jgi:hypothetical protein
MGVKERYSDDIDSILVDVVACSKFKGSQAAIDTFRYFFQSPQLAEDHGWAANCHTSPVSLDLMEWIWTTSPSYVSEQGMPSLKSFCIRKTLGSLHNPITRKHAVDFLKRAMTPDVIWHVELNEMNWLDALFDWNFLQFESFDSGKAFIDVLLHAKVDFEMLIPRALQTVYRLDRYEEGFRFGKPLRRVHFEYTEDFGWTLGWRWEFDATEPGFMVASEFYTLGEEERFYRTDSWPYTPDNDYVLRVDEDNVHTKMRRFNRGMAAKARKEMKRSGQRRVRSKIPGSWID